MLDVERWAELRREHFVRGVSIKELARRTGVDRNTVRRALRSDGAAGLSRGRRRASKLDPFKDEIHRLLGEDPKLAGGAGAGADRAAGVRRAARRSSMTTCARCGRCSCAPRTYQRTVYRPGEICQFDLWEPQAPVPVGHGQTRRGWVVVACLGYSRAGAGALVFCKQAPDLLCGIGAVCGRWARCRRRWSGTARPACTPAAGRPTEAFAAFCGPAAGRLAFLRPRRPAGQGRRRAPAGLPGDQLRARPAVRERARLPAAARRAGSTRRQRADAQDAARAPDRPADRGARGDGAAARAPPDTDRRWVIRVPPDPYLRFDTNDYSLDPDLVGRRVEVRVDQRESSRSRWTPASSPAATRARSRSTARSPRSSTPAR